MKEIYNEGRVVGLSSWELYLRNLLSQDPSAKPMSLEDWLTSSISANCSMILRVPAGTTRGYHDYVLPKDSDLCGCTVIYGSLFQGDITLFTDTDKWAMRVDDYGRLISNTPELHPETPGTPEYVPTKEDPEDLPIEYMEKCRNYLKVVSAIMLQPGQWIPNAYFEVLANEEDIPITTEQGEELLVGVSDAIASHAVIPDLSDRGFIRLAINSDTTADIYIFLHGFMHKSAVRGQASWGTGSYSANPQDGDFLGPAIFPWGCPVFLTMTTDVEFTLLNDASSSLAGRVAELGNRISEIESRTSNLESAAIDLEADVSLLYSQTDSLENDASRFDASIQNLDERVTVLENS